jgi:dihydrofolate reductase
VTVSLIAALDTDHAIGLDRGGLPWHLPDEAAQFRAACAGQWLLVGRRTYQEMTGWFQPDHRVLVLTSQPLASLPATTRPTPPTSAVASVADAIKLARQTEAPDLLVLGGAHTYAAALPFADRLLLSRLHLHTGAPVHFPPVVWNQWRLVHSSPVSRDTTTGTDFHTEHWHRRQPTSSVLRT